MRASGIGLLSVLSLMLWAGCAGQETCDLTVSYVLEPARSLPEGLSSIAVLDAGVETSADTAEDTDRSVKWAMIAADMMEQMIQDSATQFGTGLTVAKRRDTTKVLAERDMKLAGLVEGGTAAQAAQLLKVQGIIASKLNIRVEVKEGKARTMRGIGVPGWGGRYLGTRYWGGGGSISTEEAGEISRNMTVQCSFGLMDAATGEAIVQYSPKPFRKLDKASPGPIFGSSKGEEDLDSVDGIIGELVEQGTREFVSMFIHCQIDYPCSLESGPSKLSAQGIRFLRMDEYEAARAAFDAALAHQPDDHRSAYALGVTCELLRDWDGALKCYRRAAGMPGLSEDDQVVYIVAKDRVAAHKDRIRRD